MNKDQMKGKLENLKGRVKEALGAASGDKSTQAEGCGNSAFHAFGSEGTLGIGRAIGIFAVHGNPMPD